MKGKHENKMIKPEENKGSGAPYLFCLPSYSDDPKSKTHIREATGRERMHADSDALCGSQVLYDLANRITAINVQSKNVCPTCLEKYKEALKKA